MQAVTALDDQSVLLALQEFTEELGSDVTAVAAAAEEASTLIEAFLFQAGGDQVRGQVPAGGQGSVGARPHPADSVAVGRRLLAQTLVDPDTAAVTRAILTDPPHDDQLGLEAAAASAVVLGAVVAWLQTKVDIRVTRKEGKSEFEFRVTKSPTSGTTLAQLAAILARLFKGDVS